MSVGLTMLAGAASTRPNPTQAFELAMLSNVLHRRSSLVSPVRTHQAASERVEICVHRHLRSGAEFSSQNSSQRRFDGQSPRNPPAKSALKQLRARPLLYP